MKLKEKIIKIQSEKNKIFIANRCRVAESFLDRLKGLIGTNSLIEGEGLLLIPCNDIHMWMMSIPIDVIFLNKIKKYDSENKLYVTSMYESLQPWKLFPVRDGRALQTLEVPVGTIRRCELVVGDTVCIN